MLLVERIWAIRSKRSFDGITATNEAKVLLEWVDRLVLVVQANGGQMRKGLF
jgi:hypothetical protein